MSKKQSLRPDSERSILARRDSFKQNSLCEKDHQLCKPVERGHIGFEGRFHKQRGTQKSPGVTKELENCGCHTNRQERQEKNGGELPASVDA